MSEPELVAVLARHVKPRLWALWCTVEGYPAPFANDIEAIKWSADGKHLWFMLGTHNFYKVAPDELVRLVPVPRGAGVSDELWAKWKAWTLPVRPRVDDDPVAG